MTSAANRPGLSRIQRLVTRWVGPETAAALEAHSRAWLVQCPDCGHQRSIWEIGGIRYKAAGEQRNRMRCPACGKAGWHRVHKAADFPVTSVSSWPLIRFFVWLGLAVTLFVVAIVGVVLLATGSI